MFYFKMQNRKGLQYLQLRLGKLQDAPQEQSIYWGPLSLGQRNTSISKRSSEQPDK